MSEHESLTRWLRARGAAVHPDLDLYGVRPDGERGVFARRPIAKGALLLRLPRSAVLSASDGCSATSLAWMPAAARALSPVLRVALCILRECALGETSDWAPYLATLPDSYNTLEFWTQTQLEALRGTGVYDELSGLRDGSGDLIGATRGMWDKSVRPIVEASPELWPECSLESFLLACAAGTHVSQLILGPCVTPRPCHARCPGKERSHVSQLIVGPCVTPHPCHARCPGKERSRAITQSDAQSAREAFTTRQRVAVGRTCYQRSTCSTTR